MVKAATELAASEQELLLLPVTRSFVAGFASHVGWSGFVLSGCVYQDAQSGSGRM